jgi:ATP-dependent protease ClpP protease subunit
LNDVPLSTKRSIEVIPATKVYGDGTANLEFFGGIGPHGISAQDFDKALHRIRRCNAVTLLIDSSGGAIEHAAYMARALRRLPMQRDAIVVGECHSASVDILMSCVRRSALIGSTLMLHRCSSLDAEIADADAEQATAIYAPGLWERTDLRGATAAQIKKWIDVGVWFSTEEMRFYGFVDHLIEPSETIPLRACGDLTGRNRPLPSPPYVEYGDILECPAWDVLYGRPSIASRPARQLIDVPAMPASLRGKVIASSQDIADLELIKRSSDPIASARAARLIEGMRCLREQESERYWRAMACR